MSDYTDHELKIAKFALGVVVVATPVAIILSNTHGYGQRSLSNPPAVTYEGSMALSLLGLGAILGVTAVAMLRSDQK